MDFIDAAGRVLRSPAFKVVLILLLIIVLIVPLFLVYGLIWERESRAQGVRREVGQLWGPQQQILGPFLVVPYTVRLETVQGDKRVEQILERRAVFTPEALEVTGQADSQTLHRSIFEVPVYAARLKLSGRFGFPRIATSPQTRSPCAGATQRSCSGYRAFLDSRKRLSSRSPAPPRSRSRQALASRPPACPASMPNSGPPGTRLPTPISRRNRLPSRWTWPLTVQSRSPSRRSPVRR